MVSFLFCWIPETIYATSLSEFVMQFNVEFNFEIILNMNILVSAAAALIIVPINYWMLGQSIYYITACVKHDIYHIVEY